MNLVKIYNNEVTSREAITSIANLSNDQIIEITRSTEKEFKKIVKKYGYKVCARAAANLFSVKSIKEAFETLKIKESTQKEKTSNYYIMSEEFEDYCTDCLNLDPTLMSHEQLSEAYKYF